MTFTDSGARVKSDWCPLALANGLEWSRQRRGRRDQFDNLYRFHRAPLSWALWMIGAMWGALTTGGLGA